MSNTRSEADDIRRLVTHTQNTHNPVATASAGLALLKLRDRYLGKEVTEAEWDMLYQSSVAQLQELVTDKEYAKYEPAVNYIVGITKNKPDKFDVVEIELEAEDGSIKLEKVFFPLKEVLALVWRGLNDINAYTQHYVGTPAQQRAQSRENHSHRLINLLNCFDEMK